MTLEQQLLDLLTAIDNDLYQYVEKPHLYDGVYYLADVSLAAHDALEIAQQLFRAQCANGTHLHGTDTHDNG